MSLIVCDVGPRDGLQNEAKTLGPGVRAELCDRLAAAGIKRIEAASFVNPKLVPQMAGAEDVMAALHRKPGTVYAGQGGTFAWLGFGRASLIDLEIRMHPAGEDRKGHLHLAILMRSPAGELPSNPTWKSRCDRIYTDLRAYLMGK